MSTTLRSFAHRLLSLWVIIAAPMIAFTQSSKLPAFEAASVKPNNFTATRALRIEPGRLVATRMSLGNLIEEAYGVAGFQILGGPTWSNSDVYDIEAKAEHTTSKAQLLLMLQSLLADRFKLIVHRESKEIPVYTLVVGKSGSKLKEVPYDEEVVGKGVRLSGNLQLTGRMATTSQLTKVLSDTVFNGEHILDRPVLDRTGMIGSYDFTLSWKSDKDRADSDGPSIFSAVQEQLGLKLEAQKGAVEMLAIDHADKPSPN